MVGVANLSRSSIRKRKGGCDRRREEAHFTICQNDSNLEFLIEKSSNLERELVFSVNFIYIKRCFCSWSAFPLPCNVVVSTMSFIGGTLTSFSEVTAHVSDGGRRGAWSYPCP